MRRVLYRKPSEGHKRTDFIFPGIFHQWGSEAEEYEAGPVNYTMGIIENPDGTCETVHPSNIKFIIPIKTNQ